MKSLCALILSLTLGWSLPGLAQTVTITDYTGRGFAPDLVNYATTVNAREFSKLRLVDNAGQPVPCQLAMPTGKGHATLSFVTDLPANGTVTFTLTRDGKGPVAAGSVQARTEGETLVLANAMMAVRLPAPVVKKFKTPVAASSLPAPILAFRSGADGAWWGAGKVLSDRKVTAWRVKVLQRGTVYADAAYELDYAGGGYYRAVVRVVDRVPMVTVTEEYDLGRMPASTQIDSINPAHNWQSGPGGRVVEPDLWELNLTQGWEPDTVEKATAWGNGGGGDLGSTGPLADFTASILMNAGAYGVNRISVFGLFRAADAKAGKAYPGVGVTPLHNGVWRRAMDLEVARPSAHAVTLRLPMTRTPPRWVETSPFCVAPHDPAKPYTYARRQWGLLLGPLPVPIPARYGDATACRTYQARLTYGTVGLDRYKDYLLDWPSDAAQDKPVSPRVFVQGKRLEKYRAALTPEHPLTMPMTSKSFAISGNPALTNVAAVTHLQRSLQSLILSALGFAAQSHHAACDTGTIMARTEDMLAGVSAEQRQAIRTRLALLAYLFTEPDITGQGSGSHTGNPNMSLARQGWISTAIALLPAHPMYAAWRDYMTAWTAFKFADNMAPGGGWFEPGTYQEWGYQRMIWSLLGLEAMQVKDLERVRAYHLANSDFYLNLLTPLDPRWGARMIPGFGNNATHYTSMWLDAAAAVESAQPEVAAELMWAWHANGTQLSDAMTGMARPWIQPKEPALGSRYFPGFGLVFRAHQGPEETYMLLRSGFLWSHWTVDQGNVALYSKGAVLLPPQPYTYFSSQLPEHSQYNDLRFGHPANEFRYAWPDSNILDYRFGQRAQYAWASAGYPAWFITPGITAGFGAGPKLQEGLMQREGEFWWNRQVAFLVGKSAKSPNYFVFHDTVKGEGKLAQWFNLDLLGRTANVQAQGNRLAVSTEWPVSLDIAFADGRTLAPQCTEEDQLLNVHSSIYGPTWAANTRGRAISPNWGRSDGKPAEQGTTPQTLKVPDLERHVLVRIPAEPGADHFWLAYPKAPGETAPSLERLAPNVVKVTHAEGTDYILLSPTHDRFAKGEVVLEGQGAVLRVAPDAVTFALLGGAGRVGYQGQFFTGTGGFERTIPLSALQPGVQAIADSPGETLPCSPTLKGHQAVTPAVQKATQGDVTEYLVSAAAPISFREGDVKLEARQALVCRGPASVRFAVPEEVYAELTVGKLAVRGVGPFDLTLSATTVTGTVAGRMRTLVLSKPDGLVRPMYLMDGVRWYAGYPDDPAPYRGRSEAQFSLAFGVTEGKHTIEVREWASPEMPPVPGQRQMRE
jgi:hypothetical protein